MTTHFDHLSQETIERYRRGALPVGELLDVDDHISGCETCRRQLAGTGAGGDAAAGAARALAGDLAEAASEPFHLDFPELAAYVDGAADEVDREIVEAHLSLCPHCAAEMAELRAFRALMSTYPAKAHQPAEAPSTWGWLRELWAAGPMRILLPIAGVGAVGVGAAALLVAAFLLRSNLAQRAPGAPRPGAAPQLGGAPAGPQVALSDGGGRITLGPGGRVEGLASLPPDLQASIASTLKSGRVERPAVLDELAPAGPAESGQPTFTVRGPVSTVIRTTRPTFAWQLPQGATGCKVRLLGVDSQLDKTSKMQPQGGEDHWQPKAGILKPGKVYGWQVIAFNRAEDELSREPEAPERAKFKVLDADREAELKQVEQQAGNSHLALGVLYTREGLLDDAEREFDALRQANPQAPVAGELLDSLRALRPHGEPVAAISGSAQA